MKSRGTVLILGAHRPAATAIARSLHRRGVPVVVATASPWEAPIRSRAIRHFAVLPHYANSPEDHLHSLLETIDRWNVDLLLPASDRALQTLAANHGVLSERVRLGCPSPAAIGLVLDKWAATEMAARAGVPVPATRLARNESELERICADLRFPVIAKTRDKAREPKYVDVRHFENQGALRDAWRQEPDFGDRFIVQEYLPGDDVGLAVLIRNGSLAAAFQYRAIKLFPSGGGYAVMTRSEPVSPELAGHAVAVLRALGAEGVAQIDFRQDRTRPGAALLDINTRFWGSTAAAVRAGADFPHWAWQLARGQAPDPAPAYAAGMHVRWLAGDTKRLVEILRRRTGAGTRWLEIARFIADFRPSVRGGLCSWSDPVPALEQAWTWVFKAVARPR
jgi:predicted ATP-grasp superfamily ATP-dependent carboligase